MPPISYIEGLNVAGMVRTLEELLDALVGAFSSVTMQDILGWFRHCGYQAACA
jgi:hypothetical protein